MDVNSVATISQPLDRNLASSGKRDRALRIMVLAPSLPYPPIWGFGIRVYQFVSLLSRRHKVSLVTFAEDGQEERIAHLETICESVHVVPPVVEQNGSKRLAQFASLASPVSFQRRALTSRAMQAMVDDLCGRERFDVVQVESSQLAGYRFDPRAVVVLDEHNIEYELLKRMCEGEGSFARRAYNWLEYRKFRREEMQSWRDSTGCVMTSEREQTIVRGLVGRKPVAVVPNAVDIEYFRPSTEPVDPNAIVMTGLMRYRPNSDAAIHFIRETLPLIVARKPKLVFYVVGAGPPEDLKKLAGPNVVVTDTVPDVRPYVEKAAVFIVPLRMGSGTRLKVLEGLAMQKPMVSTALGCEGIDVEDDKHLLVRDDPKPFADGVVQLLDDKEKAANLGRRGRELVVQRYSWETVVEGLEGFYAELLAAHSQRADGP